MKRPRPEIFTICLDLAIGVLLGLGIVIVMSSLMGCSSADRADWRDIRAELRGDGFFL